MPGPSKIAHKLPLELRSHSSISSGRQSKAFSRRTSSRSRAVVPILIATRKFQCVQIRSDLSRISLYIAVLGDSETAHGPTEHIRLFGTLSYLEPPAARLSDIGYRPQHSVIAANLRYEFSGDNIVARKDLSCILLGLWLLLEPAVESIIKVYFLYLREDGCHQTLQSYCQLLVVGFRSLVAWLLFKRHGGSGQAPWRT
jgi:hypothetical protein